MKSLLLVFAVVLLPLAGCTSRPVVSTINQQATLRGQLSRNPLAWKIITSSANEQKGTMSTLYGNDIAVAYARSNEGHTYPAGAVLSLVTWAQRDDPHWFGARIAANAQSVEFVTFPSIADASPAYERYDGFPLTRTAGSDGDAKRMDSLVSQRAAVMP